MSQMETVESRRLFSFTFTEGSASIPLPNTPVEAPSGEGVAAAARMKLTSTGTLFINGTSSRDRIAVMESGDGTVRVYLNKVQQVQVNGSSIVSEFYSTDIKRIKVSGGAGRDLVSVYNAGSRVIRTQLTDSTGKDVLTQFSAASMPVQQYVPFATETNKTFWGQGIRTVESAPAGVAPLASISHLTQQLAFEATPDLTARFVPQADGTYLAYAYETLPSGEKLIKELTLFDYTGILVNPTSPPVLSAAGQ